MSLASSLAPPEGARELRQGSLVVVLGVKQVQPRLCELRLGVDLVQDRADAILVPDSGKPIRLLRLRSRRAPEEDARV